MLSAWGGREVRAFLFFVIFTKKEREIVTLRTDELREEIPYPGGVSPLSQRNSGRSPPSRPLTLLCDCKVTRGLLALKADAF